jgi:hypothetical protein
MEAAGGGRHEFWRCKVAPGIERRIWAGNTAHGEGTRALVMRLGAGGDLRDVLCGCLRCPRPRTEDT